MMHTLFFYICPILGHHIDTNFEAGFFLLKIKIHNNELSLLVAYVVVAEIVVVNKSSHRLPVTVSLCWKALNTQC